MIHPAGRAGYWAARAGLILLGLVLVVWGVYQAVTGLKKWTKPIPTLMMVGVPVIGEIILVTPTPTPFQPSGEAVQEPGADAISVPMTAGLPPQLTQAAQPTPDVILPPDFLTIPAIQLIAPIVGVKADLYQVKDQIIQEWQPPNRFAAGWLEESSQPGQLGNVVLIGHNNIDGDVFGRLNELEVGDWVEVNAGDVVHAYQITNKMILPELGQPLRVRIANAQWLRPSLDERLTLVTCWPPNGNTHRLILVAKALPNGLSSPADRLETR